MSSVFFVKFTFKESNLSQVFHQKQLTNNKFYSKNHKDVQYIHITKLTKFNSSEEH